MTTKGIRSKPTPGNHRDSRSEERHPKKNVKLTVNNLQGRTQRNPYGRNSNFSSWLHELLQVYASEQTNGGFDPIIVESGSLWASLLAFSLPIMFACLGIHIKSVRLVGQVLAVACANSRSVGVICSCLPVGTNSNGLIGEWCQYHISSQCSRHFSDFPGNSLIGFSENSPESYPSELTRRWRLINLNSKRLKGTCRPLLSRGNYDRICLLKSKPRNHMISRNQS